MQEFSLRYLKLFPAEKWAAEKWILLQPISFTFQKGAFILS